ncbi:unnamed protein product [Cylicostephanus goldi]|uniref:Uncharacterized protein n=1 Tax=Cylicostephanus goldi TaxID=71465 RepID=A0A3P7M3S7_CYLGO|nr:unnamed protein product [Cylicostephanus goldi]
MAAGQQSKYRLTDVLGGLSDLISRRRSPSLSRKKRKEPPANESHRKGSAPASLNQMFVPIVELVVASAESPGMSRRTPSPMRQLDVTKTPAPSTLPQALRTEDVAGEDQYDVKLVSHW